MRRRRVLVLFSLFLLLTSGAICVSAAEVSGVLRIDPSHPTGTDGNGRALLFAPSPVQPGSSISHWDVSVTPNLLMEPAINADIAFGEPDLTFDLLRDVGWQPGTSPVTLRILDPPGVGFNDPVLGPARRAAAQFVADLWGSLLESSVEINLEVGFAALPCGGGGAVLAQAAPVFLFEDFPGAPFADTWYHGALAEALSGLNLSLVDDPTNPDAGDIFAVFNSSLDTGCLGAGTGFYYGLDANVPAGRLSFVTVVLHEIAHGLGFSNFLNEATGEFLLDRPDIYSRFTRDNTSGLAWHQMNNAQRVQSAINNGNVVWTGPNVASRAPAVLAPGTFLDVTSPATIAGRYTAAGATFGPPLTTGGLAGALALADDGSATPTLACAPLVNAAEVAGKIAVVDRGTCTFTVKVKNAQDAGAAGVVVVDNVAGPPTPLAGTDPAIVIPSVRLGQADGNLIKATLAGGTGGCVPDAETLCLTDSRFRVTARWRTLAGNSDAGNAVPITDDTGYFWFFNDANVEMVIKVLNACGPPFNRFWVFAGGLTNVEVSIRVEDTVSGAVRTYLNPQITPFQPIQDTEAFATCP